MDDKELKDKGGRRLKGDRRSGTSVEPVSENRKGKDRRDGSDRRDDHDPVIRITGDERREAYRDIDTE